MAEKKIPVHKKSRPQEGEARPTELGGKKPFDAAQGKPAPVAPAAPAAAPAAPEPLKEAPKVEVKQGPVA